jgi:hypothetical protein
MRCVSDRRLPERIPLPERRMLPFPHLRAEMWEPLSPE